MHRIDRLETWISPSPPHFLVSNCRKTRFSIGEKHHEEERDDEHDDEVDLQ
jgi:hypothetical protein